MSILPDFILMQAERAISDALNVEGMHTNGKTMVSMEVSQFQRLLIAAKTNEDCYTKGYDDALEWCYKKLRE